VLYSISTLVCTRNSLLQEIGRGGEGRLREVLGETPFNVVLEARP